MPDICTEMPIFSNAACRSCTMKKDHRFLERDQWKRFTLFWFDTTVNSTKWLSKMPETVHRPIAVVGFFAVQLLHANFPPSLEEEHETETEATMTWTMCEVLLTMMSTFYQKHKRQTICHLGHLLHWWRLREIPWISETIWKTWSNILPSGINSSGISVSSHQYLNVLFQCSDTVLMLWKRADQQGRLCANSEAKQRFLLFTSKIC